MKHIVVMTVIGATLAGCANLNLGSLTQGGTKVEVVAPELETPVAAGGTEQRPIARPTNTAGAAVVETATTPAKASGPIGVTVASLGSPAETGLWLKTPLVKVQQEGRVAYNGKTANVLLIPIEGQATAGSRMSLQAFQALGAPLTDLVEVNVSL
jgi:hypothetical protein|tara:strand:+ start:682 stop:1146 length:465 start_codon:yes stop_codon:yes gene_type:complete